METEGKDIVAQCYVWFTESFDTPDLEEARDLLRNKNDPDFDLRTHLYQITGVDLTRIDGLQALTVQQIISETGLDMTR